jgi:pyruvate,water dikinase
MKYSKEKIAKALKNNRWLTQRFNGYPLYMNTVASNTGWMIKEFCGVNYSHFFLNITEDRAEYSYDVKDLEAIGQGYYLKNKSISDLKYFINLHRQRYFRVKKANSKFPKNLQGLTTKKIISINIALIKELTLSVGISHAIESIAYFSEKKLEEILNKRAIKNNETLHTLSSPVEFSFIAEAQLLLWEIKTSAEQNKEDLITKFIKAFYWIDNSYIKAKVLTKNDVIQKYKDLKHPPSLKQQQNTKNKKINLIKKLKLTESEIFVIKTIELCTKWQDDRKKYLLQTISDFEIALEELSKRLGVLSKQLKYISPNEFTEKNLLNQKTLKKITSYYPHCAYYALKNNILAFPAAAADFLNKQFQTHVNNNHDTAIGMIACKGKVTGPVKICKSVDDIERVKKGDILITSMTRPEFLPAMQKAIAFVTDEGGITSHAAIVSREMNKPCIIGTKNATKIFKDGDLVEVDANNGTVKKIK